MNRFAEVAKRYRPAKTVVLFRKDKQFIPAHAVIHADGTRELYVPSPVCRESLFIYLHECGHMHLGHCKPTYKEPLWKQEWEAEQWAIAAMRRERLPVPRSMITRAKLYIKECIEVDHKKGRSLPSARIMKWCGYAPLL